MSRTDWKYLVDCMMFVCLTGIIGIGLLMAFVIAEGPVSDESSKWLFGLHRHQWGDIHLYLSLAFIAFFIIHLVLEWSWITAKTQRIFKDRWGRVLASMIPVSVGIVALFWLASPKNSAEYREYGTGEGRQAGMQADPLSSPIASPTNAGEGAPILITGQTSLKDIERATGIDARELAGRIGLPAGVPLDGRLGRLRRTHGISIPELRTIVEEMLEKRRNE